MPTQAQNRRYKLHQRIKNYARYSSLHKTIYLSFKECEEGKLSDAILELKHRFYYTIQIELI